MAICSGGSIGDMMRRQEEEYRMLMSAQRQYLGFDIVEEGTQHKQPKQSNKKLLLCK